MSLDVVWVVSEKFGSLGCYLFIFLFVFYFTLFIYLFVCVDGGVWREVRGEGVRMKAQMTGLGRGGGNF